jgi:uncharacterized protein YbaP (TraB family)
VNVGRLPLLACAACTTLAWSGARADNPPEPAPSGTAPPTVEDVLVTGEQPGPGMWRVSKDGHELWILGTLDPLPKRMTWRSREAEAVLARSQAILAPPGVSVSVGFFKGLVALPALLGARTNRGGRTLRDELPETLYQRWLALRELYLDDDDAVERLRPSVAAHELFKHAIDRSGLVSGDGVWALVDNLARRHKVPVTPVTIDLVLDDPKGTIRQLGKMPHDQDVACLASTMQTLESDLQPMRRRATLWATGDVEGLRHLPFSDQRATCFEAITAVPELHDRVLALRDQLVERWLAAAERALAANPTSFAVLPIGQLLEPDGWVARLRARGYAVDEP